VTTRPRRQVVSELQIRSGRRSGSVRRSDASPRLSWAMRKVARSQRQSCRLAGFAVPWVPGHPGGMHKTTGVRDPAAAFPLPGTRDDAQERRQANQAVVVSAIGLAATGIVELVLAVLTGSVGPCGWKSRAGSIPISPSPTPMRSASRSPRPSPASYPKPAASPGPPGQPRRTSPDHSHRSLAAAECP